MILQEIEGAQRCAASFALFQTAWSFADIDGDTAMASLTWYVHTFRMSFTRFNIIHILGKLAFIVAIVEKYYLS